MWRRLYIQDSGQEKEGSANNNEIFFLESLAL